MVEKIGEVTLDYEFYPGDDFYCDGKIEDDILQIVREKEPCEYRKTIEEWANWPVFYHLSTMRENIVSWLPIDKRMKVLEVGSGCGAITGALSERAGSVTCIELSKKRSTINATRHKDCANVTIKVGNFKDIEDSLPCDYDYIFLIGVFEYAKLYMNTENSYEDFMMILKKHLGKNGRLAIAIENKFGMKYWAGCKEDHTGRYFDSIENYPNGGSAKTFTKRGLQQILKNCKVDEYSFFYPYPDYKLPTAVFSDERLPETGELYQNIRNFDRDRLLLFDEQKAYDAVLEEGMYPEYSNSYMVVTGPRLPVVYSKFSNDRAPEYAIRTDICKEEDGAYYVRKQPLTKEAISHVQKILQSEKKLTQKYFGSGLNLNACKPDDNAIRLEFLTGETLEKCMDKCIELNDKDRYLQFFHRFLDILSYQKEEPVTDWDMIFQNIILSENGAWTAIDYEWTFDKPTDVQQMAARAVHCYIQGDSKRRCVLDWIKEDNPDSFTWDEDRICEEEREFQNFVENNAMAASDLRNRIGYRVTSIDAVEAILNKDCPRVQIYADTGNGFSEAESFFIDEMKYEDEVVSFHFAITEKDKKVRIDPSLQSCVVTIIAVECDKESLPISVLKAHRSGHSLGNHTTFFAGNDPNYTMKTSGLAKDKGSELSITMKVCNMDPQLAEKLAHKMILGW